MSAANPTELAFRFHNRWAEIPDTPSGRNNGRTHGVEVLPDGRIAVFCQAVPGVLFYDKQGNFLDGWGDRFVGAHGMSLTQHQGEPAFWLVDQESCEVVKTTLDGDTLLWLDPPPAGERPGGKYMPTWADQAGDGTGDVWVGDGYGGAALYRYGADSSYKQKFESFDGLRLDQPHGVRFAPNNNLWVTDRGNHRVLVLDAEGQLVKASSNCCHSPCSFAFHGDRVFVAELFGAVTVVDHDLNVIGRLGENPWLTPPNDWPTRDKWVFPDEAKQQGYPDIAGTEREKNDCFSSPHGIAADPETADVYVAEWMVGGRIIKLEA